jgi:hypothetical protein
MKQVFIIITLILSNYIIAQKVYKINQYVWHYNLPKDYVAKIDNFEKEIKAGNEYFEKEKNIPPSTDDIILLALEKKDSTKNAIFVSYKDNYSIKKYTLNGYAKIWKDILLEKEKKEYPNDEVNINLDEVIIDKINFIIIKETINFKEDNYIGTKYFYIADIDGKEFMIVAISVNETDRKIIDKSILTSTFKKERTIKKKNIR